MALNINHELKRLQRMTVTELRAKYQEVFGEVARSHNKTNLWKRIAWRMQANEEGGLSDRALRRAKELANEADLRRRAPGDAFAPLSPPPPGQTTVRSFSPSHGRQLPIPGTVLTREYKGQILAITVLDQGFEFDGAVYRSLSAVAKTITGSHLSGHAFFGLRGKRGKNAQKAE